MSKIDAPAVERILANTINETARGDPDALASRITAALAEAGYGIVPANGIEDTALGPQPFDKLTREMRPQDHFGNGRDWTFRTGEHGGDEPDNMPQTIKATDAAGRWAIYVPLTRGGKIVCRGRVLRLKARPARRRDSSIGALTVIAGSSPVMLRQALPSSGTRRTLRQAVR